MRDAQKQIPKFVSSSIQNKIVQHFGDSATYDFSNFTKKGKLDFCFIDGGHSYECVKNDTEKCLSILAQGGALLWHDFCPNCRGVYRYLIEIGQTLPLRHISNTSLVIYYL
jgi:predicted O-methyltransferase YrrM